MSLQGSLSIERMCQLAGVSRAGFYRSFQEARPAQEDVEVRSAIQQIALEHRGRYGYRRIAAELRRRGMRVNHKRVVRMMREDNLLAVQPQTFRGTSDSDHEFEVYLNLASRMKLTGINQLWVADLTYIRLQKEFVYLAVILDAFSRRVVGWALERTLTSRLTLAALERAIRERSPSPGLVHHSDRGVQYAAGEYMGVLQKHQIIPSMSRPAHPYDNASCESFIKTLKKEEIYANDYQDLDHLRANIEAFIDRYYNHSRLHSALGYRSPEELEQALAQDPAEISAGPKVSFFRHEEIYRTDESPELTRSGPKTAPRTIGIDESPAGYSSASCSPAELASASPAETDSEGKEVL
jgi:putative transposase